MDDALSEDTPQDRCVLFLPGGSSFEGGGAGWLWVYREVIVNEGFVHIQNKMQGCGIESRCDAMLCDMM